VDNAPPVGKSASSPPYSSFPFSSPPDFFPFLFYFFFGALIELIAFLSNSESNIAIYYIFPFQTSDLIGE